MKFQPTTLAAAALLAAAPAIGFADDYAVGHNVLGSPAFAFVDSGAINTNPSFSLTGTIIIDPNAGVLFKRFRNTSNGGFDGITSGTDVPIVESFKNVGNDTWTQWNEFIASATEFTPNLAGPGFLFNATSIVVKRNGNVLAPAHYVLTGHAFTDFGNTGYDSFIIDFAPSAQIQPNDTLEIDKSIHEVVGDSDNWVLNESAGVTEYPDVLIPEPTTALLATPLLATLFLHQRRRPTRSNF